MQLNNGLKPNMDRQGDSTKAIQGSDTPKFLCASEVYASATR